ncbi:nitroreductase [Levilactobacillus bambusae]|uniref:Nitroreductase n=1 Tax=Levilactobacillus bambusae TaxID=2024736 RepID=A0A2V1MZP8_9LACO|nr:nitroreductase [Levilactobacillus bambusae]PWG00457.1 nitroreductase [Levilactobacillus bambusae]
MTNQSIQAMRHSAHEFSDREVDLDTLKAIVSEAQLAPSWENTQPWKAYLAVGKTAKQIRGHHKKLAVQRTRSHTEVTPPRTWAPMPQANLNRWMSNMAEFYSPDESDQMMASENDLFNAPAILYLTMPKGSSAYSAYDVGAFGYGILLAAADHGVGSLPAYELIRYPAEIREEFDIPEDEAIFMGIALGYAKDDKLNDLRTTRTDLDQILQIKN